MKSPYAKTRLSLLVACIYTVQFHVSNIFNFIVPETRAKFLTGIFGRLHQSVPPKPSVTQRLFIYFMLITWPVFFSGRIDKRGRFHRVTASAIRT